MASPSQKPRKESLKPSSRRAAPPDATLESVDPIWLVKAFGVILLASLVCGYLSLCLLFYQGQWQLVLHPSRKAPAPATIDGTPLQVVRFGVDESATPQLTGWWISAESMAHYSPYTVLYLPSGDGSLADAQATLAAIHSLGLNLFAFDYRGYGHSAAVHPNEQRMTQDAASAWQYLTVSRALPASRVVLFGDGAGCFLAAQLAAQHPEVPAVILDSPRPDLLDLVLADPRVKSLPVRALFHERFDISESVRTLTTPKLFLLDKPEPSSLPPGKAPQPGSPSPIQLGSLVEQAASPKRIAHLTSVDRAGVVYSGQISRFLDEYLH